MWLTGQKPDLCTILYTLSYQRGVALARPAFKIATYHSELAVFSQKVDKIVDSRNKKTLKTGRIQPFSAILVTDKQSVFPSFPMCCQFSEK